MAVIRKHLGRRVLIAERLERREMFSGDGLVASPLLTAPVEAVVVVAGDDLQQQIRAGDRDQVHNRVRDFRCAPRPALETLAVQSSLSDQVRQRDQLRIDDPLQTQLRTKTQSQVTISSLAAAVLSSAMDQSQVRDRDQLKGGLCNPSIDQTQDRDRIRLRDPQLTVFASVSAMTGDQQRDRDQAFDGLRDRDQLQERDQSCITVVVQPRTALV